MTESPLRIVAEPAADPDVCRFVTDRILYGGDFQCTSEVQANGSPLAEALFAIAGVRQVRVAGNTVTVVKTGVEDWRILGKAVGAALREAVAAGGPLVNPRAAVADVEDSVRHRVEAALAAEVNPGLASHGGKAELAGVEGTRVFVRLSGGCQGCGAAQVTLRQGIERILRAKVPEVSEVVDITDHAAGSNPYFAADGASPLAR